MTWFKVDDQLYDHPKVMDLPAGARGHAALALWVLAGSWACRHLRDGVVTAQQIRRLGHKPDTAEILRTVGLWHGPGDCCDSPDCIAESVPDDTYVFHDWPRYQPMREDVEDQRRRNREKVAKHRRLKAVPPSTGVEIPDAV